MGIIFLGIFIVFIVIITVGIIKQKHLTELDRRATESLRNNRIVQVTNPNAKPSEAMENNKRNARMAEKPTAKFIEEHSNYTKEQIEEYFLKIAKNMLDKTEMDCFTASVASKVRKGKGMSKIGEADIKGAFLMSYAHNRFATRVTVWNKSDEYIITIFGTVNDFGFEKVDNYTIQKGVPVGL
ncbi:MAG: hypothetical protein IJH12_04150 [Clostridia bacterium]|nr:hypothetical protein [Clostridia bacterium]